MTYHMEKTMNWIRSVDLKSTRTDDRLSMQFPWKLWQAVNGQDFILVWNEKGTGISVNASHFEATVMQTHPGLVEIPTFANFRRQMREYGFDWTHCKETGDFTFTHPSFVRGRKDLIHLVVTRRKSKCVSRGEAKDRVRRQSTRKLTRQSRSYNYVVSPRSEPVKRGYFSRMVPDPSSFSQLRAISGQACQRSDIRNIRLRNLEAEPQPGPTLVEQWISLVPSPSSTTGFGVPVSAFSGRQDNVTQNWYDPVGNDGDRNKGEESSWWNECFPWILQQDSDLCRQFEIDNLSAAVSQQSQRVGIPLHFYSDNFQALPETIATYPRSLDSPPGTSGGFFDLAAVNGAVIEIKPIPDDEDFLDV